MTGQTIITPFPGFTSVTDFDSVYALVGWVIARIVTIMLSRDVTVARSSRSRRMRPRGY